MKKYLILMILISTSAYATTTGTISNEVIPDFSDQSVPVLNQTIRKIQEDVKTVQSEIPDAAPSAASQSDMETGTSLTTYVSPGVTKYSSGVSKGWALFDGTSGSVRGTAVNVGSIVHSSTGLYRVIWTTPFSSQNYSVFVSEGGNASTANDLGGCGLQKTSPLQATSSSIQTRDHLGNLADFDYVTISAFGDQ